jgi:hypothetical protein
VGLPLRVVPLTSYPTAVSCKPSCGKTPNTRFSFFLEVSPTGDASHDSPSSLRCGSRSRIEGTFASMVTG